MVRKHPSGKHASQLAPLDPEGCTTSEFLGAVQRCGDPTFGPEPALPNERSAAEGPAGPPTDRRDDDAPSLLLPAKWGKLAIRRQLGSGAFADVYLAHDPRLDLSVALKLYRLSAGTSASESIGRGSLQTRSPGEVLKEGRLMARLRHPNVVLVRGAEQVRGQVGIWMELIEGLTLDELLRGLGVLGPGEVQNIGREVSGALAAVHAAGILHRDITGGNVMRERGGRYVLMDFGVGEERRDGDAGVGPASGTPLSMAPETLLGRGASVASDVYSLGVLLFHLLTGRFPVEAESLAKLVRIHRDRDSHPRTSLRDHRPGLPVELTRIIERAIEPDPGRRFESAGEMERALLGSTADRIVPVEAKPGSLRGSPARKRGPRLRRLIQRLVNLAVVAWIVWEILKLVSQHPSGR